MADLTSPSLYSRSNLALHHDIISKAFQGKTSRAFLFSLAINVHVSPKQHRHLDHDGSPYRLLLGSMNVHMSSLRSTRQANSYW
ncbi:hypothetical protein RND81_06G252000 [Saponaria officinalis]|uniref:Yippee domain-containing protein n=1 Tax=Saponaria officinalis TaxID=3572 RepID=A0AAW1KE21_SAPOF